MKLVLITGLLIAATLGTVSLLLNKRNISINTLNSVFDTTNTPMQDKSETPLINDSVGKKKIYQLKLNTDNTVLLIGEVGSNASGGVSGQFNQVRSRFASLDRFVNKMDWEIAARVGVDYNEFQNKLNSEIWLDAEDTVAQHFADHLSNVSIEIPDSATFSTEKMSQTKSLKEKIQINL